MKKLLIILFVAGALFARENIKNINKTYPVESGAQIIFETISGMEISLIGWDKDEVQFDLKLDFSSSDRDYEKKFVEDFEITELKKPGKHKFVFSKTEDNGGWNFFDLFKLKFSYYENMSLSGTIYIPKNAPFNADFRYGEVDISGLTNTVSINGKGNELKFNDCTNLELIQNDYGDISISNSGGNSRIKARSNNVIIRSYKGDIKLSSDYSEFEIEQVEGNLSLDTRSANIRVSNVSGAVDIDGEYSDITLRNLGFVNKIKSRSGTLKLDNCKLENVLTAYMDIDISGVHNIPGVTLYIENQSGTVRMNDIKSPIRILDKYSNFSFNSIEGDIDISSRSGYIKGVGLIGNWSSDTEYSSVELFNLTAKTINIKNRSNPVELNLSSVPESINIDNQYGGVDISIPKSFGGKIKLYSTYGSIKTNLPIEVIEQGSSQSALDIIPGGNSDVFIKTRSGDIDFNTKK